LAAGYHVYRSTTVGGPYTRLNDAPLTATAYSDDALNVGATYYYVVTALDGDGDESVFSEEVSVVPTDSDSDQLYDLLENAGCTDAGQSDSDGDGLADGAEDANHNGRQDAGETDPCDSDSDGDGLPDGWETAHGLDSLSDSGSVGSSGDVDGDGWTNYQEYHSCTAPDDADSVPGAPTVPALNYPVDADETDTRQPWLSVNNAADADCQDLRYVFELYSDAELTTQVAATPLLEAVHATDADLDALSYFFEIDTADTFDSFELEQSAELAQQAGDLTGWTPLELMDNTTYHWRVRAYDGATFSAWRNGNFFVNLANDAPGVPTIDHPGDQSDVTTRQPPLAVKAAVDADLDQLSYDFELYADADLTQLVTDAAGVGLAWQVDETLDDNRSYFWHARAIDAHGAAGDWSATASFFVNTANEAPAAPVLNNPINGGTDTSLTPTLSVFNADDLDQDALSYEFELDADGRA
jgi:hypothetical protein